MTRSITNFVDISIPSDAQLLVLSSLDDGPKHGHAMRTVIQQAFGKELGPGALYGAINRLADKGWIVPLPKSARRQPYEITERGRAYLRQSLAGIRRLAESGPSGSSAAAVSRF
jgi:DNA-binding PadR family transcriptional regulator